jgi:hypothetical protein
MDETEPLEWYERLLLQCVIGYGIVVVSGFYLGLPLSAVICYLAN